jgi:hypothetical protein
MLALAVFAALPALAKASFSGDWKLNTSRSNFGEMPPPSSMSTKIAHEEPKLRVGTKISGEMGDFESDATYTTDGKECTNEIFGNSSKSTVKWEGDALLFETKGRFGDNDFTMKDKWTLSGDGKYLTIDRHFSSSMGESDQKLVFEKQ